MSDNLHILLVDDEIEFLEIMHKFLTRRNLVFKMASTCYDAIAIVSQWPVDVCILDVCMPGMDGFSCMQAIRALNSAVEIIFLSGHASPESALESIRCGAFDYCLKPVDFDDLYEKILLAGKKKSEEREFLG